MISDFIFDGRSLSEFGYVSVFDNTSEEIVVSNMDYSTIKGARSDKSKKVGYNYSDNYSATFSIIKNTCNDPEDEYLTNDDVSELTRWLVRKQYKWFRFVEDETEPSDNIWYQVKFKVWKEYAGDNCIGLKLELQSNAPYGFTKKYTYKFTKSPFKLSSNSDEEGYIYPDFEIVLNEGGDFELKNYEEERSTTLKNCVAGEKIYLYGEEQQIDSTNEHDYVREFNYKFPRLVTEYGKYDNNFIVNLDCEIYVTFRGIRKVGLE